MAYSVKNSLFVRNLSPNVTEGILREVFGGCDEIDAVIFRAFPNKDNQFFAQIDFKSSKGITEGTQLNGTAIMGTQCLVGVIDPLAAKNQQDEEKLKLQKEMALQKAHGGLSAEQIAAENLRQENEEAQYFKRQKEEMDDQGFRTVHLTGFKEGVTEEALRMFCEHFGEVNSCRVEEPEGQEPFALIEFTERGPAHVVKTQKSYEVDGRIITFSEAKVMVEAQKFAEKTVHFQQPIFDTMNMRAVLNQQQHLSQKLAKVREAAMAIKIGEKAGDKEDDKAKPEDKKEKKDEKKVKERDRSRSRDDKGRSPLRRTKKDGKRSPSKKKDSKKKEQEELPDEKLLRKLAKKMLKDQMKQKKAEKKTQLQKAVEEAEADAEGSDASITGAEEEPKPKPKKAAKKDKKEKKKDRGKKIQKGIAVSFHQTIQRPCES